MLACVDDSQYVLMILCTTTRSAIRPELPNCVLFQAGQFNTPSDCVAQSVAIHALEKGEIDIAFVIIGRLDAARLRDLMNAIGDVIDWDCEPN